MAHPSPGTVTDLSERRAIVRSFYSLLKSTSGPASDRELADARAEAATARAVATAARQAKAAADKEVADLRAIVEEAEVRTIPPPFPLYLPLSSAIFRYLPLSSAIRWASVRSAASPGGARARGGGGREPLGARARGARGRAA